MCSHLVEVRKPCCSKEKVAVPLQRRLLHLTFCSPSPLHNTHGLTVNSFDLALILLPGEDEAHSAHSWGERTPCTASSGGSSWKLLQKHFKTLPLWCWWSLKGKKNMLNWFFAGVLLNMKISSYVLELNTKYSISLNKMRVRIYHS